jgi:murein DD-endopeptidase MepM/ murein hydrolase activator NlpD
MRIVAFAFGIVVTALGSTAMAAAGTPLEARRHAGLADTETALGYLFERTAAPLRTAVADRTAQLDEEQRALWTLESELARARTAVGRETAPLTLATGRAVVATLEASVTPRREVLTARRAELNALTTAIDSALTQRANARELALAGDPGAAGKAAEADTAARAVGPLAAALGIAHAPALAMVAPVAGSVSSPFGPRGTEFHDGVDFAASLGAPVVSAAAGTVVAAGQPYRSQGDTAFGVIVEHAGGFQTLYWHLAPSIPVRVGQQVEAGTLLGVIALTGRVTGPHLHFGMFHEGRAVDPARVLALAAR